MSSSTSHVENEINDHKEKIKDWLQVVGNLKIPESNKKVVDRFTRDCHTLTTDLDNEESPSSADLNDYCDRKNSLEVQYTDIVDQFS